MDYTKTSQKFFNKHYKLYKKYLCQYLHAEHSKYLNTTSQYFKTNNTDLSKILQEYEQTTLMFNTNCGKAIRPYLSYITFYNILKYVHKHNTQASANISKLYKEPAALMIGAYLELIHDHLLIHDDIMDTSIQRRNKPTVWYNFYHILKNKHKAYSLAILSGNTTLVNAFYFLTQIKHPLISTTKHALAITTKLLNRVIYGQILDISIEKVPIQNIKKPDLLLIYKNKTAIYTNIMPVMVVENLFKANNIWGNKNAFYSILLDLGIIYQILDDIADLTTTKKTRLLDIVDKKRTLLVYYAYKNASNTVQHKLLKHYNSKRAFLPTEVAKILHKYGLPSVINEIHTLWNKAKKTYNQTQLTNYAKAVINQQFYITYYYFNKILGSNNMT